MSLKQVDAERFASKLDLDLACCTNVCDLDRRIADTPGCDRGDADDVSWGSQ